ncbi:hypothetical protein DER44DRAFT_790665 [Fusarium oxysporum]|nr:hypothetical protein DER44DRAFT_790665 [Fusarium oxysporum]
MNTNTVKDPVPATIESREFNSGLLIQLLTLFLYKLNKTPYLRHLRKHLRHILLASSKLYIKATAFITLAEAKSTQFITQDISILVLKVYYSFKHKGHIYILMERIQGQDLS